MSVMKRLHQQGQSVWLDYIRRSFMESGELTALVEEGLRGLTSNPSIFEQAISGGTDYDDALATLLREDPDAEPAALFEAIAVEDIRMAADTLRPVYDESGGDDGFVSLEVSPHLANDTDGSIREARHLWSAVDRPNLMIKIPATDAGYPAIRQLIGEGINVNVTLMFSLAHYEAVASAYIDGVSRLEDPSSVASVASFFVSRVETKVDAALDELGGEEARALRGTIAVANAKLAYQRFREVFHGEQFGEQRARGARVQRVLYGSTSTKDPAYPDLKYVEELVGPETVNTIPPETLEVLRGESDDIRRTLGEGLDEARRQVDRLGGLGIDLDRITEELQVEGVRKFADSYDELMDTLAAKKAEILGHAPLATDGR